MVSSTKITALGPLGWLCLLTFAACLKADEGPSTTTAQQSNDANQELKGATTSSSPPDEARKDEHLASAAGSARTEDAGSLLVLEKKVIFELSKVLKESKRYTVHDRCTKVDRVLNELIPKESLDSSERLRQVIETLSKRKVPFGQAPPYVEELRECINHFQSRFEAHSGPKRTVVATPHSIHESDQHASDQMAKAGQEFLEVRSRTVDPKIDLYAPRESKSSSKPAHRTMDVPPVSVIMQKEEELARKIRNEHDQVKRLTLALAHEREINDGLFEQVESNWGEMHKAWRRLEELERKMETGKKNAEAKNMPNAEAKSMPDTAQAPTTHDQKDDPLAAARLETMKELYEQVRGREDLLIKQVDELKAQLEAARHIPEHKDNHDKTVEMVVMLHDKMAEKEPLKDRCQRYYMLLNFPKKKTKKVVKTIANLPLPESIGAPPDDLYETLEPFAAELEKSAEPVAHELDQCLSIWQPSASSPVQPFNSEPGSAWTTSFVATYPSQLHSGEYIPRATSEKSSGMNGRRFFRRHISRDAEGVPVTVTTSTSSYHERVAGTPGRSHVVPGLHKTRSVGISQWKPKRSIFREGSAILR